ncbi:hypothetical protein HK407_04g08090 [Ordospora pajunii]|jgi:hypothetical protein|uniref:uncharacterized protein n=1 Tax=Ordospora pajunii TaxID=3039483 RepID=UPI0029526C8C|nr:uncharacterized protein HK407_04g08090 [Ordospora pajunii]KAH9411699.1 hypothetical protein HK407_04g08090 [Ordospora pajunii]
MSAFDGAWNEGSVPGYGNGRVSGQHSSDSPQACMEKQCAPNYMLSKLKLNIVSMFEGEKKFHEPK